MAGLESAARQLASYGRGPDKMLAHISPDEAAFIDKIQGGTRTNPHTGLPEYSLFGKILKAAVRVGATAGAFVLSGGNPAAAAAAAGAATKLTGGSWKQALKAGALSGVTAGAGNYLSGGSIMSNAGLSGAQGAAGAGAASGSDAGAEYLAATGGVPEAAKSGIGAALAPIGGTTGAMTGLSAIGSLSPTDSGSEPARLGDNINLKVNPYQRVYRGPPPGDLTKYGQQPGGWKFFDTVNPQPQFLAGGGGVMPLQGPALSGPGMPRGLGIPSQIEAPHLSDPMNARLEARDMSPAAQRMNLRKAAMMGYGAVNAKTGGSIAGPGTGTSDSIPAMLSDGEHVIDQQTVVAAGHGNVERGHRAIERFKQKVRRDAGMKHPEKPPAFGGR